MPFQRELRDLAYVPRWSIVRVAKPQSVAEHSYYTAMYAYQVADLIEWKGDRYVLILMALWHDVEECFTGDIPGPIKHRLIDMKANDAVCAMMNSRFGSEWSYFPPDGSPQIIKVASLIDDAMFLAGEIQRGNEACRAAWMHVMPRLQKAWAEMEPNCTKLSIVTDAIMKETYTHSTEPDK
jgi:5'-deoxynucleotidase YfbR-like HD superfamily hydrolase